MHDLHKYVTLHGFSRKGSELQIGHWPVSRLVERYGTPLYVYDGTLIEEAYNLVCRTLPQFEVFYSMKANPSLAICTLLNYLGSGVELASGGELHLALTAGFEPSKIVFAGPAKTDEELALAVEAGIASVNVESFGELSRLESIAQREGKRGNACLRINTKASGITAPEVMVGGPSRFGIDEELAVERINRLMLKHVNIVGIHVYTASQILDTESVIINLRQTLGVASVLSKRGTQLRTIVFGGGFGVPYDKQDQGLDMTCLANRVNETIETFRACLPLENMRLILELGRFLVARAGIFLTKVVDVKKSRGKTYLSTDGGMNQFLRPAFMKLNHPTLIVTKLGEPETEVVDIGGPLCTPLDIIAKEVHIPKTGSGDIVGLFNAGAYGFSMSMLNFLSHPKPAEVLFYDSQPHAIRKRGTFRDVLSRQTVPRALAAKCAGS